MHCICTVFIDFFNKKKHTISQVFHHRFRHRGQNRRITIGLLKSTKVTENRAGILVSTYQNPNKQPFPLKHPCFMECGPQLACMTVLSRMLASDFNLHSNQINDIWFVIN